MLSVGPRYFDAVGVRLDPWPAIRCQRRRYGPRYGDHQSAPRIHVFRQCRSHRAADSSESTTPPARPSTSGRPSWGWRQTSASAARRTIPAGSGRIHSASQNPSRSAAWRSVIVRGRSNPGAATPLIRKEIFALDPDLPLTNVRTMDENLAQQRWFARVFGTMFTVFAGIAIVLAAVGLVCGNGIFGDAAHAGNRCADGARGSVAPGAWLILRRGFVHLVYRLVIWVGGGLRRRKVAREHVVSDGLGRSTDLGLHHDAPGRGRDHRVPLAGVASDAPQSRDGAATRMKRLLRSSASSTSSLVKPAPRE